MIRWSKQNTYYLGVNSQWMPWLYLCIPSVSNCDFWTWKSVWELTYHAGSETVLPPYWYSLSLAHSHLFNPFTELQHKEKVGNVFLLSGEQPKIKIYRQRRRDIIFFLICNCCRTLICQFFLNFLGFSSILPFFNFNQFFLDFLSFSSTFYVSP